MTLHTIFATKQDMTQAWTQQGKRLAVTKCVVEPNKVVRVLSADTDEMNPAHLEIGYGRKKLANMPKPLRSTLQKGGFSEGVTKLQGVTAHADDSETTYKAGDTVTVSDVLEVGDVVKVQASTKGKGFAGVMKRHNFAGGPATHGQSDRERAPGSIGAGTDPGRVWKGQKMAGHMGATAKTVEGLVVIHLDPTTGEVWLSGPVPGHLNATVRITKTGKKKNIQLDKDASGIAEPAAPADETEETSEAAATETDNTEETTE